MKRFLPFVLIFLLEALLMTGTPAMAQTANDHIQPYEKNPRYWQLGGQPVLLLGGSVKDCLFQIPDLEAHLDLLHSVGGNYVRNTMSDRVVEGYEIKAFGRGEDGLYDLNTWNDAYWQRFANLLEWTAERDIVVQIEVWDRFDHSRQEWLADPFNPDNNINYTAAETGLEAEYPDHPGRNKQPFFYSVPALKDNTVLLPYQQAFVDKMLSYSLQYGHVLYCMDNETSGDVAWGAYWNEYIKGKAATAGVQIETTEMWDQWDVKGPEHRATFDHPQTYSFVDISQNSWKHRQENWDNAQWVRAYIAGHPRPLNSTKIYGAQTHPQRDQRGVDAEHAVQCFWRNIIGGLASSRFHRPPAGIGLSPLAQSHIRSGRLLSEAYDFFNAEPDADSSLLRDRQENQAYLSRVPGRQYAVYFPDGGAVGLDLAEVEGAFALRWLDIAAGSWQEGDAVKGGGVYTLTAPTTGHWLGLLSRVD
jgi:hypothetical protein